MSTISINQVCQFDSHGADLHTSIYDGQYCLVVCQKKEQVRVAFLDGSTLDVFPDELLPPSSKTILDAQTPLLNTFRIAQMEHLQNLCPKCESKDCGYSCHAECRFPFVSERESQITNGKCADYLHR